MFVLAHLSDPHLGPLPRPRAIELASKRVLGYVNWRRNRVRSLAGPVLGGLVEDMLAQSPDHITVTGDLVNIGLTSEIVTAAKWLEAMGSPNTISVIPGNHDAYVPGALAKACIAWGPYLASDNTLGVSKHVFPYIRRRGPIALIGMSSARPSAPFMATGQIDSAELRAMGDCLARCEREGLYRVVLIHHPPAPKATSWHKRLVSSERFRSIIREFGAELILHGHTHLDSFVEIPGPRGTRVPVIGVPSASNAPGGSKPASRYNLFAIDGKPGAWRCSLTERGYGPPGVGIEIIRERTVS